MKDRETFNDEFNDHYRFLGGMGLFFLGMICGLVFGVVYETRQHSQEAPVMTGEEKREHMAKLKYHGLQHQMVFIHSDRLGEYFIRDGRRCPFVIPKRNLAKKEGES
jgi:hypothetical protein